MKEDSGSDDVDSAEHDDEVRIYVIDDNEIFIQSDMTVDEYLPANDAEPDYTPEEEDDTNGSE